MTSTNGKVYFFRIEIAHLHAILVKV